MAAYYFKVIGGPPVTGTPVGSRTEAGRQYIWYIVRLSVRGDSSEVTLPIQHVWIGNISF